MRFPKTLMAALVGAVSLASTHGQQRRTFEIKDDFLLDGKRLQIRCGEIHAARVPVEYWRHRLKMAKAMGLNTVCAYLFWNLHEPEPGRFRWDGEADAALFCRMAQEEGLWVMLRPGPYSCAEWEMGGLPWWLLKNEGIELRSRDPKFMEPAKRYLREVGRVLAPLQVSRGGPILMVQVENEYGFYGKDVEYMGELRQTLLDAGFNVPLFACNPKGTLRGGFRGDLFPVVNFGSDPAGGFAALREILPKGPLMCGEFYPGWFDTWGAPHHRGNTETYLRDLEIMLKAGGSFSIYMAHGGTSFGFWSGCDRPFKPDTSSYDYDAPISEAGWVTEKFKRTRDLFSRYLLPGESIPEAPPRNPVVRIAPVEARQAADLFDHLPAAIPDERPRPMEQYDQGYGCILYRAVLPPGPAGTLDVKSLHDIGHVYLDGRRIGFMDRRKGAFKLAVPGRTKAARLDILVEAMGRVNFGREVHDRKGIEGGVKLVAANGGSTELRGWEVFRLPLDGKMLAGLKYRPVGETAADHPRVWRVQVDLDQAGDTFLDMRGWGKGMAWVNGRNLGRYWSIGPQQTMYVPGPWLKRGSNEILILDLTGPRKPEVAGLETPVLDELHPEWDFGKGRPKVSLELRGSPVHEGSFAPGSDPQELRFKRTAKGRYFCLETLSAQDGRGFAAVAEISLLDGDGKPLSTEGWTIAHADSEETRNEDGSAENAIDGQTANQWHTRWSGENPPGHPHHLVIDLGTTRGIGGLRYTPRQGDARVGGRIKDFRIHVGDALVKPQP